MTVYRVKLFTTGFHKEDRDQQYCIDNKIVAIGWGDANIKDTKEYLDKFDKRKDIKKNSGEYQSINNLKNMEVEDFVWTKIDGRTFLLGKIKSDVFLDDKNRQIGLTRKCEWKIIDFNDVPGKIMSSFVGLGSTLQRVNIDTDYERYCEYLYNDKKDNIVLNDYKQLLHYDDLEDLLGLYLQYEQKYYIIPSTNKQSTKLIEYELRNIKGEKACIQCKIGNSIVNTEEIKKIFKDYKIYISILGNDEEYEKDNVTKIKVDTLWEWAKKHQNLLPERIKNYINLTK